MAASQEKNLCIVSSFQEECVLKMVYGFVGWNAIDRNIQKQVAFVSRPRAGFAPIVEERSVGGSVGTRYICAYLV